MANTVAVMPPDSCLAVSCSIMKWGKAMTIADDGPSRRRRGVLLAAGSVLGLTGVCAADPGLRPLQVAVAVLLVLTVVTAVFGGKEHSDRAFRLMRMVLRGFGR